MLSVLSWSRNMYDNLQRNDSVFTRIADSAIYLAVLFVVFGLYASSSLGTELAELFASPWRDGCWRTIQSGRRLFNVVEQNGKLHYEHSDRPSLAEGSLR